VVLAHIKEQGEIYRDSVDLAQTFKPLAGYDPVRDPNLNLGELSGGCRISTLRMALMREK
jgi:hypothetical protein